MAVAQCEHCGVEEYMPYACKFCKGRYCAAHRLPENHSCQGLDAHREQVRAQGRIYVGTPDVVSPSYSTGARASMSLDALWSKLDGKMTFVIIGTTIAAFILQLITLNTMGGSVHEAIFVISDKWLTRPWTIITSVFAHGSINHLFFNMLVLFFFGGTTEKLLGTKRFTYLYLGAGAVAGIAQVILTQVLFNESTGAVGASGALQGVMGTLVILAPRLTVLVFFIIPAPLWALTIVYVVLDVLGAFNPASSVAHFAHLAGLVVGLSYGYHLKQKGMRAVIQPPQQRSPWG